MDAPCLARLTERILSGKCEIGPMESQNTQHSLDCSYVRDTFVHLLIYPLSLLPRADFQELLQMLQHHGALEGILVVRVLRKVVNAPP